MTEPVLTQNGVPVLSARGLSKRFGGLLAVNGVDLDLHAGRLLGVIGPNGAGKSTMINALTGHTRPTQGTVTVDGDDYTGVRPWKLAKAGVARTFQIVKPFRGMTVTDNVAVAALYRPRERGRGRAPGRRPGVAAGRRSALEVLDRVGLAGKGHLAPAELSVADARRLELAKALALKPRVLLLDEVLAGLRPAEIDPALELIDSLRRDGLALLMVEHVMHAIATVSDDVLVLQHGKPATVLSDERVVAAYLGHRYAQRAAARKEGGTS